MHLELARACESCVDYVNVDSDDEVLIIADTIIEDDVIKGMSEAAASRGAEVVELIFETRPTYEMDPPQSLLNAIRGADITFLFNKMFFSHSPLYRDFRDDPLEGDVMAFGGMHKERMIRMIDRVDYDYLCEFEDGIAHVLQEGSEMEITARGGTELTMEIIPDESRAACHSEVAGHTGTTPIPETMFGTIVVDGFIHPPDAIRVVETPVELQIEEGIITDISGGYEADYLRNWLDTFNHDAVYKIAHQNFGNHPTAALTGFPIESERIYGCCEYGFGGQTFGSNARDAPAHYDLCSPYATVTLDDRTIIDDGQYVAHELVDYNENLRPLWVDNDTTFQLA